MIPSRVIQTVLAFDFGLKRIGIASGDTLTRTAAPRAAVPAKAGQPDWDCITRQVRALQRSTVLNLAEPNHIRKRDVDDPRSTQFCLRKKMIRLIGKRGKKKYAN